MKNVESIQNTSKGCLMDIHKSFMRGPSFNVFWKQFCDVANHPKINLAKFGYILDIISILISTNQIRIGFDFQYWN
jgi:hypothetical protein